MSEARKCDRCGKFYEPYSEKVHIHRYKYASLEWYDLCPECNAGFVKWMNKHRKVISNGRR